ncbi:uncharacterized protein LOC125075368 [Vanessa atalanta]|uniref:uncharacterized protein LOC125075368 n=1 Tax=Vanessa atalanta TaxID=42275 RepID=UPI001FCE17A4|nr:uncharacterized protein LOC125075368 [Vanessa atalanta]
MESKNEVFVISLDAVDVNLLPTSYKYAHEKIVPLWTKSNLDLRNNDYYEFEIRSNECIQPIDKKNVTIEFMACHICDMDVPRVYLNEHNKSFKHKFNTKIADVALKRLQLYMTRNDNTDSENIERDPSKYYCLECSIIVDRKDEITHKKSMPHKNSVLFERFLKDFLHLYTNDDQLDVEDTQDIKTETVDTDNEFKIESKRDQVDNKRIAKNPTVTIVDKPKMNLEDYLTILNNKVNTKPMFFKANGNYVEIEALDGSVVRVSEESFHALRKLGQKFIQCMICKDIFDLKSYNEHILSDGHMKMVSLPLKDKHCERQISDSWRHCLVCNAIIECTDLHTLCNTDHSNNLQNLLISDKVNEIHNESDTNADFRVNETVSERKLLYNDVLKSIPSNEPKNNNAIVSYIDTNINNNIDEIQSTINDETNRKRFCDACNVSISTKKMKKHENTMKHIFNTMTDSHYLLKIVDVNLLRCKVCEVDVRNHYDDIDNHFSHADHVNNYDKLLNANSIIKIDKITYYCAKCNVSILFKNEFLHIESREHKIQSNLDVKPNMIREIDETENRNDTIDKPAVEPETNVGEIVEPKVNTTVEQTKNVSNIVDPAADVCKIVEPDTNVSKSVKPVTNVTTTIEQTNNVAEIVKPVTNVSQIVESIPSCSNVDNSEKNVKTVTNINKAETIGNADDPNYYFCHVCQVKVPNNYHNIKVHTEGRPHKKNLDQLEAKLVKKRECMNKGSEQANYLLSETKTFGVINCIICKVELSKSEANIKTHLQGVSHTIKYKMFLKENRLVVIDDDVYCAVCVVQVGRRCEISHCTGKKHITNLKA